jgi:hypothetical protein
MTRYPVPIPIFAIEKRRIQSSAARISVPPGVFGTTSEKLYERQEVENDNEDTT